MTANCTDFAFNFFVSVVLICYDYPVISELRRIFMRIIFYFPGMIFACALLTNCQHLLSVFFFCFYLNQSSFLRLIIYLFTYLCFLPSRYS